MYLKSIELQGFKSFAGKTKLEFHNGVTGIVGPNGSGKSNIGDAVRWVLGEQSAKSLRGGNMQDVIFAGTEKRKPLGFASVAITLDNADRKLNFDADEVTVTRKLYRSGESEYLLNGRSCRLRDINELFYDTGIGKEGYSIIGQGQIEKILSGKPEDRRELFDEAAGIVKFKRRKAASLKKLGDEQANLVRVKDILSEVSRQIGPLEHQSKKAEEYLAKRDRLRTMEIQLFQIDEGKTATDLTELTNKKAIAENHLEQINQAFEHTRKEYDQVEIELEQLDQQIQEAREEAQKDAIEKQQHEGQVNVLREQIRAAEQNSKLLGDRLAAIDREKDTRQESLDAEKKAKEEISAELKKAEAEKQRAEEEVRKITREVEERTASAEQSRSETIRLLNSRSQIKERMQRYDTMLEQIEIRKSELNSRMLHMMGEASTERDRFRGFEEELKSITDKVVAKRDEIAEGEKKLAEYKEILQEDNRKLEIGQTAYHREASRLESLRNITERYEGYGNSIKKVMEQKDNNPGIHGVIADLIKTDEKYETAIETALGGAMQNIVTDNEATAKYLIEYLKRGHFGRATFLPLTAMKDQSEFTQKNVLKEQGVLGIAATLVRNDKLYDGVVQRLLGKTVVVDTIDHAIAVSRRYRQSVRMVTLEGELLSPGGSMTGGSFKYNSNLLGRRRQIQELESSVRELKKEMEELQKEIVETRDNRNEIRDRLAEQGDELHKLSLSLNTAKMNYNNAKQKADALEGDYGRLQREKQEIEHQIVEINEKNEMIGDDLKNSEEAEKNLADQIRRLTGETEDLRKQEQEAAQAQDAARLAYSNIRQKVDFADERMKTIREELDRISRERQDLVREMEQGSGDSEMRDMAIADMEKLIGDLDSKIQAAAEKNEELRIKKEELNKSHKTFFEKRDQLSQERTDMDQECFRLAGQIEKLQETRENQINYLYEEYQLTPDQAEEIHFEELPERGPLKKDILGLKGEIKSLGNVNVNAIEEYKELRERHDFLQTQHDDLIKATEALQDIIDQLDEGMRKQFKEKFGEIKEEFDKVFRLLFGGGKGTLELVEGEDILESGVVIISQPPGKKLQNMMQLSGGEKALTAIALLFAIQNLKPSPFCLLDEIEAALDDNNVGRFAKYLHKLTQHTQFIVVTHRRGTMAAADRLYGITMQEKGISTLVSVDLIENQLDA